MDETENNSLENVTWSVMEKYATQAKKVDRPREYDCPMKPFISWALTV